MPQYTACFRTAAECAFHSLEADSPEHALELALELWRRDPHVLSFERYVALQPLDRLEISGPEEPGQYFTFWQSDDVRLRKAADKLIEALKNAVEVLASVKASGK